MGLSINNVSMNYFLRGVDAVDKKTDSNLPGADKGNVANDAKVGRNKLLDETCAMVSKLDQWPQGGSGRRNCHGHQHRRLSIAAHARRT